MGVTQEIIIYSLLTWLLDVLPAAHMQAMHPNKPMAWHDYKLLLHTDDSIKS